jgi:kynurenine formamidase
VDDPPNLVDLSVPIVTGMPVYPGDPAVVVAQALSVTNSGVNVNRLHLGSQSGTHVDAPYHVDDDLPPLERLPLERFTGPAVIADARGRGYRTALGPEVLPDGLAPGVVLLIATGWSAFWGTPDYLAHPYLTPETCAAIVASGVRTVGVDALSVDRTPASADEEFSLAAHRVLAAAGTVIAENLTGLERLLEAQRKGERIEVSLFPLRLTGDGAPVRAVARITGRS